MLVLQYVEGMKLLSYELMDSTKGGAEKRDEHVLSHYASHASQLVMELVWKVQKVGILTTLCTKRWNSDCATFIVVLHLYSE